MIVDSLNSHRDGYADRIATAYELRGGQFYSRAVAVHLNLPPSCIFDFPAILVTNLGIRITGRRRLYGERQSITAGENAGGLFKRTARHRRRWTALAISY